MINHEIQRTGSSQARRLRFRIVAVLLVVMLAFPALAAAQSPKQSPTDAQYGGSDVSLDQQVKGSSGSSGETGSGPSGETGLRGNVGPLPFTGFDVIAMAAVALAVTGLGLALQRAVARESTDQP